MPNLLNPNLQDLPIYEENLQRNNVVAKAVSEELTKRLKVLIT